MPLTSSIRFDGQAAIVTGAGGGIGRSFALALASRGAQVLVNDYGGDTSGHAGTSAMADKVAAEIVSAGGHAVANCTPVGTTSSAKAIVKAALDAFGRVDILVNNAGIALPGRFDQAADDDVENLFRINLLGPYALMRAVWPLMREQAYGRILNISSNASMGIGGSAAYGTAKAGLIGLSLDTGIEGKSAGILVNALMPTAYTRLIEQIPDPDFVAWFRRHFPPEAIAAAALYFLSRESDVTGHVLSTGGGKLARVSFAEGRGLLDTSLEPETVRDRLAQALTMEAPEILLTQSDEAHLYAEVFPGELAGRGPSLSLDTVINTGKAVASPAQEKK